MKISQEVRDYAAGLNNEANNEQQIEIKLLDETISISAQGMAQKSAEFKASGSEIYQPIEKSLSN